MVKIKIDIQIYDNNMVVIHCYDINAEEIEKKLGEIIDKYRKK
jgi:hypothetical protein